MLRPMTDDERCLTTDEMREADRRCIEELGIPGAVLMDHAGRAVFEALEGDSVGILCGKGNNGGDGYVVARYAMLAGKETHVLALADPEDMSGDARMYADIYRRLGGRVQVVSESREAIDAAHDLAEYDEVVDALLGTGLSGEIRGLYRDVITNWPQAKTIAVDAPSGLDGDTGEPLGCAVHADVTVTIAWPNAGFRLADAARYTGRVFIADIGIPRVCADDAGWAEVKARTD